MENNNEKKKRLRNSRQVGEKVLNKLLDLLILFGLKANCPPVVQQLNH